MEAEALRELVIDIIRRETGAANGRTGYRPPLVGCARADDALFASLRQIVDPEHLLPGDMLRGARTVIAFFLPFTANLVAANRIEAIMPALEWRIAYGETNALIDRIGGVLVEALAAHGVGAVAAPATHNYDRATLSCRWAHKSVAVIAGLGSFGLNHLLITDAGCAGRLGSLVIDAEVDARPAPARERCGFFLDGGCRQCLELCPVLALHDDGSMDKQLCNRHLQDLGSADVGLKTRPTKTGRAAGASSAVCGKCAMGACALGPAV